MERRATMSEASSKSAPHSTRGKVLMVIAAAVVAALGYLAWSAQKPRAPAPDLPTAAPASRPAGFPAPASRPALVPRRSPRGSARAPVVASAPAPDGGPLRTSLTKSDIRTAQANLHRAADACVEEALKANPKLGLRMAVRYTLYVKGGEARAVNPRITKSMVDDALVEKCIVDKITRARWNVDASDGILHVAESFNFKHLQRTHIGD
jgi:hypothetical protein